MAETAVDGGSSRRRLLYIAGGLVAVVVLLAGLAAWWFLFRDDAPPAVDLGTAVAQLDEDLDGADPVAPGESDIDPANTDPDPETPDPETTDPDPETTDPDPETTDPDPETTDPDPETTDPDPETTDPGEAGISGEWMVDTTIGTFDYETASGSFAGFRVNEELTLGKTTAVGRTGDVSGTITIEGTTLVASDIEIDLTTITTNRSQRDSQVQTALETTRFPTASFSLTAPVELPGGAATGESFTVQAVGDLTLHGVTNQATFTIDAQLVDDIAVVVGSTEIAFDDYDVTAPSAPIVLSVEDHGIVEFQLLFTR